MSTARSRKLRASLGDSWGDAEYESDGGHSIHSASDEASDLVSESDAEETDDIPTPQPATRARASPKTPQNKQVKTPATRKTLGQSPSQRTPRSQPRSSDQERSAGSLEPTFIMPSVHTSAESFRNGSPGSTSKMRSTRRVVQPGTQTNSASPRSRLSNTRSLTQSTPVQQQARPARAQPGPGFLSYYLTIFRQHVLWPVLRYLVALLGTTMGYLQPLFAAGLAILLALFVVGQASKFLQYGVQSILSPICVVPFSAKVIPFCAYLQESRDSRSNGTGMADFGTLMKIQSNFEDIVKQNEGSIFLPFVMKNSESAIRDLRTVVRHSNLPSRNELEVEFDAFIGAAKQASSDLIKYNNRIGATVDGIINTNKWTMRNLQDLHLEHGQRGILSRSVNALNALVPFAAPAMTIEERAFDQYLNHLTYNKDKVSDLIQMGTGLLLLMKHLDERLETMHEIAVRDDTKISRNREELLTQLWTKLGGNAATRKGYERQLALLQQVTVYRSEVFKHVRNTLVKLEMVAAALEDLRDTVAEPEVLGYRESTPLLQTLAAVEDATLRLQDARGEARRMEKLAYRAATGNLEEGEVDRELPPRRHEASAIRAKGYEVEG